MDTKNYSIRKTLAKTLISEILEAFTRGGAGKIVKLKNKLTIVACDHSLVNDALVKS